MRGSNAMMPLRRVRGFLALDSFEEDADGRLRLNQFDPLSDIDFSRPAGHATRRRAKGARPSYGYVSPFKIANFTGVRVSLPLYCVRVGGVALGRSAHDAVQIQGARAMSLELRKAFERYIEVANDAEMGIQPLQLCGKPQLF